jgi:hypothetical protein
MTEHAPPANSFTEAELATMHRDDYSAGQAIVIIMLGIFSIGVFLYACVAYTVAQGMGFLS